MHRVEFLLNFAKDFFMEHTYETINENVLLSIKVEAENILTQSLREFDDFYTTIYIPTTTRKRFQKLNTDFRAYADILRTTVLANGKFHKRKHLDSSSIDEEETFSSFNTSYESLRMLFLELEIHFRHWKTLSEVNPVLTPIVSSIVGSTVELKKAFFEELFQNYAKLNKLVNYASPEMSLNMTKLETINGAKQALEEFNKDDFLKFMFHRVRDTKKILKILANVLTVCSVLFGDKAFANQNSPTHPERKESGLSDYLLSLNRQTSSIKFSMGFSKIRTKRESKGTESILDDLNRIWEDERPPSQKNIRQLHLNQNNENLTPPKSQPKGGQIPGEKSCAVGQQGQQHDFHNFESKCYCQIF